MGKQVAVFLQTTHDTRGLQRLLQARFSGYEVRAYGRWRDFAAGVAQGVSGVLTLREAHGLLSTRISLQGKNGQSSEEEYVALSRGKQSLSALSAVGLVDVLGRQKSISLAHELVRAHPKVELVTKVDDLVALIRFRRVDAVLLPERLVSAAREGTEISLSSIELKKKRVGLAALSTTDSNLMTLVRRLPASVNKDLGVTGWA